MNWVFVEARFFDLNNIKFDSRTLPRKSEKVLQVFIVSLPTIITLVGPTRNSASIYFDEANFSHFTPEQKKKTPAHLPANTHWSVLLSRFKIEIQNASKDRHPKFRPKGFQTGFLLVLAAQVLELDFLWRALESLNSVLH